MAQFTKLDEVEDPRALEILDNGMDPLTNHSGSQHDEEVPWALRVDNLKWIILGTIILLWFILGTAFYMSEGYDLVTSLYALVQVMTTVGYGDVLPVSQYGKLFFSTLILLSVSIVAGVVSNLFDMVLDKQAESLMANIDSKAYKIEHSVEMELSGNSRASFRRAWTMIEPPHKVKKVFMSGYIFAGFILVGTVFFAYQEKCSCSYGRSSIEGCKLNDCEATGGTIKTPQDAFYMSVVTLTTVGFGDETALSQEGRLFSIVWMLLGVTAMINFVGDCTDLIQGQKNSIKLGRITRKLFHRMDADGSGTLDKVEFLTLALEMNGLATQSHIRRFLQDFHRLDRDGSGHVTVEECKAHLL